MQACTAIPLQGNGLVFSGAIKICQSCKAQLRDGVVRNWNDFSREY
jgi:hypothetical protein